MKKYLLVTACLMLAVVVMFTACKPKAKVTLKLDKDKVNVGEVFIVSYTAPDTFEKSAWIGIIPSSIAHGNETTNDQHDVSYKYLNKSTSGQMSFTAPMQPGSFDLRMHDTDNNGKEVAYVTFTVVGAPTPPPPPPGAASQPATKSTTVAAATFSVGDPVEVNWKGSWWPARVIVVGKNSWKIHYDGHSSSWDEWVGPDRIRKK